VRSSHIPFKMGKSFSTSWEKETDGGQGTSLSVKTMRTPPANVMDRVGFGDGARGNSTDSDTGDVAVDDEIGTWGLNEKVGVTTRPVFATLGISKVMEEGVC
jgi:hypothetical protein